MEEILTGLSRGDAAMRERFPRRRLLTALLTICDALDYAHARGVVHRDLSPSNLFLTRDGQMKVLDFGVAKAVGRSQTTRDGQLKGKLGYMSPEQITGRGVTHATDIFAASTVLWEALTGERLFRGENEGAIMNSVLTLPIEPPK
jgi:serine/threonine-protein kinase